MHFNWFVDMTNEILLSAGGAQGDPSDYAEWLERIKRAYCDSQLKAAVKVNTELLRFYWTLGHDLVTLRAEERWGAGIVDRISLDFKRAFPRQKGFSKTNLWYIKKWYLFYAQEGAINKEVSRLAQCDNSENRGRLEEMPGDDCKRGARVPRVDDSAVTPRATGQFTVLQGSHADAILHQPGGELQELLFKVPWRHHCEIITRCSSAQEAIFYLRETVRNGWSRAALCNAMATDFYNHKGKAITNFAQSLPNPQSKLAQDVLKDPYNFDFLTMREEYDEMDLEDALSKHITQLLLELGKGFAFCGRQVELVVSGTSYRMDMLFYHIQLKCYVVVELKARAFQPEFAGKLNFYVTAVDRLLKGDGDNPTIGLLICKTKDATKVEWAFNGINKPLGVAAYELNNFMPNDITSQLPTIEEVERSLKSLDGLE